MTWLLALTVCAGSALAHQLLVVPRLPRAPVDGGDAPPDYARLATPRDGFGVLTLSVLASAAVLPRAPEALLPLWVAHLGGGAALAWVDLRTTWLPRRLNHLVLAQVLLALAWVAVGDWRTALAAAGGGLAAFALFHLAWSLGGGFGYGDVRLAGIVGAVAGTQGLQHWVSSILLGTVTGALWGAAHALRRRWRGGPTHFPYGPALWLGPVAAAAISGW